jgi:2-iminobutanoate/2-iminopropanoate deaminase
MCPHASFGIKGTPGFRSHRTVANFCGAFRRAGAGHLSPIDTVVKRAGGSLKDVVTITVYLTDPRLLDPLMPIRRELFAEGNSRRARPSPFTACRRWV